MMKLKLVLGATLGAFLYGSAVFAGPVKIDHTEIPLHRAQLVVSGPSGETAYSPQQLETIGFQRLTTVTPWREAPAAFDGVLLTDILAANGLDDAHSINVVAENDYVVQISAEVWKRWPILVATRVNGKAHTRRQRGPIQFVLPMSEDRDAGLEEHQSNWVWMAARIEAVYE